MATYRPPARAYYDRTANGRPAPERSLSDLFSELSSETSQLVRQEMALARAEMTEKAKDAGRNTALIVAGATLANAAVLALVAAAILGLSLFVTPWVAALIVSAVVALIAGILTYAGVQALREMNPVPERTMQSIEEDVEWISEQIRQ